MALMSTVGMQWVVKNRGKSGISSIQGDLRNTAAMMRRMAGAALAAAGIGGLGYLIKQSMKTIDQMGKLSDELNISTETLGGLKHAAAIYGTEMTNVTKGLQIFVRRMGEARVGMGEARHGLEAMGISAERMAAMGTEGALLKVADHISKIEDATQRAQIAYTMFGRQGVEMINMLMAGSAGIREMVAEADKLGVTFSRLDAAKVEAANDALARMRTAFTGLVQQMAISFSPYMTALADQMTNAMTSGGNFGDIMVTVMEEVAISVAHLTGEIVGLLRKIDQLRGGSPTSQARKLYKSYTKDAQAFNVSTFNLQGTNNTHIPPKYPRIYQEILAQQESKYAYDADAMAGRLRGTFSNLRSGAANVRANPAPVGGSTPGPWAGGYSYGPAATDYQAAAQSTERIREQVVKLNEAQQRTLQLSGTIASSFEDWALGVTKADQALNNIMNSITRMIMRIGVTGPLEGVLQGGINRMFEGYGAARSNGAYWSSTSGGSGPGSGPPVRAGGYHGGGMYGEASFARMARAGDFASAPRYHGGIGPGEQRAIINKTEGVFTQGQMKAIGRGMTRSASPTFNFSVVNETGQSVEMEQGEMEFDFDEMVATAVLRLYRQRGDVYDATKQVSKDAY